MASPYGLDDEQLGSLGNIATRPMRDQGLRARALPTPTNPTTAGPGGPSAAYDRGMRMVSGLTSTYASPMADTVRRVGGAALQPDQVQAATNIATLRAPAPNGLPDSAPSAGASAPAGSRDIGNGIRRVDQVGANPLYTNVDSADSMRPGVSVVPSDGLRSAAAAPAAPAQPGGMTVIGDSWARERDARNQRLDREKISDALDDRIRLGGNGRGNTAAIQALGRNLEAFDQAAAQREVAGLRDQGDTTRARMQAEVLADNNRRTADVTMRGQDLDLAGKQYAAANQRTIARMEQMNKDRQYALDVSKFGEEKAQNMQREREQGNKSFRDWAGSTFVGQDGKPDGTKVADFETAAVQTLGNMITRLQQKGDSASLKRAEELQSRGLGALDAQDRATLRTLYDRRQRFTETRGSVTPFSASGPVSNDLFDFAITGQDAGLVQRRVKTAGGQSIPVNDLRYTEPANALLPDWGKTPTTSLGPTLEEQSRMKGLR